MLNLIGGAAPPLVGPGQDAKRSNDEGLRPLTTKKSGESQKDSFREVLRDSAPQQSNRKPESREGTSNARAQEKESPKSREAPPEPKNREVDKASTSSSRTKKSQGSKEQMFQEFMDSFESETGIPSARLAEALAQISQLPEGQKSPEETADLVLNQLDIPPDKEDKARALYLGFLAESKEASRSPVVLANMEQLGMADKNHMLQRVQANQQRKSSLNESLDQLNQRFWMTRAQEGQMESGGAGVTKASSGLGSTLLKTESTWGNINQTVLDEKVSQKLIGLGIDPRGLTPEEMGSLKEVLAQGEIASSGNVGAKDPKEKELAFLAEVEEILQERVEAGEPLPDRVASPDPVSTEDALFAMDLEKRMKSNSEGNDERSLNNTTALPQSEEALLASAVAGKENASAKDSFESYLNQGEKRASRLSVPVAEGFETVMKSAEISTDQLVNPGQEFRLADSKGTTFNAPGAVAASSGASKPDSSSVNSVIQQAQYLVKQGGGEMTVKMTPEGLGEVTIKVVSENGKVNVQLATESAEAKKLFESNINDLKNQLNAQKLSTEMVKVDVIQNTNTDQNVQSNLNQQQNLGHQQTRQFWNQFQENFGNRSQRDGYLDFSNTRRTGDKERDPLQPIETKSRVSTRSFENKGRGLNLVA